MLLGDARSGKLTGNLLAFARTLRRAGVLVDTARVGLAQQALVAIGLGSKKDVAAALEAVMVSREHDRGVFSDGFNAFFKDPEIAAKLLGQMLPSAAGKTEPVKRRARVREALAPQKSFGQNQARLPDEKIEFDAAMTASASERIKQADFNQLSSSEYALVERLAREVSLPVPRYAGRRTRAAAGGPHPHWPRTVREATRTGSEPMRIFKRKRLLNPLPLLVLIDVSGSMERYARMLLSFIHAATRGSKCRDVFTFGNRLTDLSPAFKLADTDAMLTAASAQIADFAGGTQLGCALATLRQQHARRLVGRRTLVLLISDGLDTGEPAALANELQWLKRNCGKLLWLNPLLRFDGYQPTARAAAVLSAHADGMLAVHNLNRLETLAAAVSQLMKSR